MQNTIDAMQPAGQAVKQPRSPHTLLITAAGTGTAYAYVLAVRKHFPALRLITADTNPAHLVAGSCLADKHVVLPLFDPGIYTDTISNVITLYDVTHYLPIIDPEILFASAWEHPPCTVMTPDAEFCRNASNKSNYQRNFVGTGLNFPETFPRTDIPSVFPCWAKGDGGFGGRTSKFITCREDLAAVPGGWFLQEHIDGCEYTVDCYPDIDGQTICSVRERLVVKAGVCTHAHLIRHRKIENMAATLSQTMRRKSPFCFQAIERNDGSVAVTDINPRLGAGTALSVANGMEFFAAHLASEFGGDPLSFLKRRHPSCYVGRQYTEFLSPEP